MDLAANGLPKLLMSTYPSAPDPNFQETLCLATDLVHDDPRFGAFGAVVPPIAQTSLFTFETMEALHQSLRASDGEAPYHYSRVANPTVRAAEVQIAALEGTEDCRLFGSGMAAIATAILHCVRSGSHAVCVDTVYGPTRQLLSTYVHRFGVTVTFVDGRTVESVVNALQENTHMIYLESPSSMFFRLQDIAAIAEVAKKRGILTVIDNTYNTPLHFRPHDLGVDLVCHSVTKYLSGHSDVTAGAICGTREHLLSIIRNEIVLLGAVLHPLPAWLVLRGLRTLPLRLMRHEQTAKKVAEWLETRPEVHSVHHIGLDSHPQRELALKQFRGTGGLFSFEPRNQDTNKTMRFCNALRLFQRGISWGGHESLVVALRLQPADYPEPRWVVRLYCGLEEPADLFADLERCLPHLI